MDLTELYRERNRLKQAMADEMHFVRKEYGPKIESITEQIESENQKGIKKRMNAAVRGKGRSGS